VVVVVVGADVDVEAAEGRVLGATAWDVELESPPEKRADEKDAPAIAATRPAPTRALRTPTECINILAATAVEDRSARMGAR